ncbi:hypothetical protein Patl1_14213 [Pistacia atlantica]|nr:hypothetical protein Patl1_14213 [Pistacia atlantica]
MKMAKVLALAPQVHANAFMIVALHHHQNTIKFAI